MKKIITAAVLMGSISASYGDIICTALCINKNYPFSPTNVVMGDFSSVIAKGETARMAKKNLLKKCQNFESSVFAQHGVLSNDVRVLDAEKAKRFPERDFRTLQDLGGEPSCVEL